MSWYTGGGVEEVAIQKEVPSGESGMVGETTHESDDMPPSLYVEAHKVPLVLEILDGVSAYGHFDMTLLTREVDRYIIEDSLRNELGDTKDGYEKVVQAALDKLDLPDGTDIYAKVEKLVRYFRIQHKLYSALREREELEEADPATLSAEKLKLYIERGYGIGNK